MAASKPFEEDVRFSESILTAIPDCLLQIFERVTKNVDPTVLSEREAAVRERVAAQYERAQHRLAELVLLPETPPLPYLENN